MFNVKSASKGESTGFSVADFFVLRTPLLPFRQYVDWSRDLEAPRASDQDLSVLTAALQCDRLRLRERLRGVFTAPPLREALFVASPVLEEHLEVWIREPETKRGQRVERALTRYFSRMTGRATPFGLFAGYTIGSPGPVTRLEVGSLESYQRHTRLDMDYVSRLADDLIRDPRVRHALIYRPNSSLYRVAGQMRYAEVRLDSRGRTHQSVALELTEYLEAALHRASSGVSQSAIVEAVSALDVEPDDAANFVQELIDAQVVVPDLWPPLTGPEPMRELARRLGQLPETSDIAGFLTRITAAIDDLDGSGLGNDPKRYRELAKQIEGLQTTIELPHLFQVDLVKPASCATLCPDVMSSISQLVELLHRITPGWESRPLSDFRDAFVKRYDQREVPLAEALDEETGIGFKPNIGPTVDPSPLLHDLPFARSTNKSVVLGHREKLLLSKLEQAARVRAKEIGLDEDDLNQLENKERLPLPTSFGALVTLISASPNALAQGDFQLRLLACGGPSGANVLGRFCQGDQSLEGLVRKYLRQEKAHYPNAVVAEIVHLPFGRMGNVLGRPVLREYEIPYLAQSGAPEDRQISVSDLLVSIRGPRIVLRSKRLGCEVIPRMTNAHNFHKEVGLYSFLCSLAAQDVAGALDFSWGGIEASFLPRVIVGRFVLSLATWRIEKSKLASITKGSREEQYRSVQRLRRELELPRFVHLSDGDHRLPVDLDNSLSVDSFIHLVKRQSYVKLEEMFPGPDQLCVSGSEGLFLHEIIVPFTRDAPNAEEKGVKVATMPSAATAATVQVVRRHAPGSEWLYAKLYCGTATADRVLRDLVVPMLPSLASVCDQWFFLRYGDPDWHIRLRCHGSPERLQTELWPAMMALATRPLDDGRLWRIQVDTYEREVERYGGPEGILLAECVFHEDSRAVLEIIDIFTGDEGLQARWQLGLQGIDFLLDDLDLNIAAKHRLMEQARDSLCAEFKIDSLFEHHLGHKYRKERAALAQLFDTRGHENHPYAHGLRILQQRSVRLRPILADLREKERHGRLTASLADIAHSLIHMHANRILRSNARAQELVLYDFLCRIYESSMARSRLLQGSVNRQSLDVFQSSLGR